MVYARLRSQVGNFIRFSWCPTIIVRLFRKSARSVVSKLIRSRPINVPFYAGLWCESSLPAVKQSKQDWKTRVESAENSMLIQPLSFTGRSHRLHHRNLHNMVVCSIRAVQDFHRSIQSLAANVTIQTFLLLWQAASLYRESSRFAP
jgi:hypothetical protein